MKILVLNCGSSSIKYKLFDMDKKEVIAQGGIEKIGLKDSFLKFTLPNGEKKILEKDIPEHTVGVEFILNTLTSPEYGAIKSLDEINADTVIADCDDIDSLALFSVVVFLKQKLKKNVSLVDLSKCTTVGDIVELAMK